MTELTSRVLSFVSNSGLRIVAGPTSASTAVPPRAGFGTVATGWHPTSARAAANAAAAPLLLEMRRHPDVGDGADEEAGDQDPRGPVDLPFQASSRAVPAAEAAVATADRAAKAGRLRGLDQHAAGQQHGEHGLRDDQCVLKPVHGPGDST